MTARAFPLLLLIVLLTASDATFAQNESDAAPQKQAEPQPADRPAEQPAQPAAEQPEAQPDQPARQLAIVVTAVKGLVQVRAAEDQPWRIAQAGMNLNTGAEFRTGPKSRVQFRVGKTQTITLDRLGTVKVLDAIQRSGKISTDIGMKYGRTELQVEAGGIEHESKIHSPSSTLAVRGSGGVLESDSFLDTAYCIDDKADVVMKDPAGRIVHIDLPEPVLTNDKDVDPNKTQKMADAFNPLHGSTTPTEDTLLAENPSGSFINNSLLDIGGQSGGQSTMDQIDTISQMPLGGMFTSGTVTLNFSFISQNSNLAADVDLLANIPGLGEFGPGSVDPNGVFAHSGNNVSAFNNDPAAESIVGGSSTNTLPTGNYAVIFENNGPANADIIMFSADVVTGGGGPITAVDGAGGTINVGQRITIPFNVPAMTQPAN